MIDFSTEAEAEIVSDLIDLCEVPLRDAALLTGSVLMRIIPASAGQRVPVAAFNSTI
jgi:hypothetical protein